MLYFTIILMIALLSGLFWLQRKQEHDWLQELEHNPSPNDAQPFCADTPLPPSPFEDDTVFLEDNDDEMPPEPPPFSPQQHLQEIKLFDDTIELDDELLEPHPEANVPVFVPNTSTFTFTLIDAAESDSDAEPREIITREEASRNLRLATAPIPAEQPQFTMDLSHEETHETQLTEVMPPESGIIDTLQPETEPTSFTTETVDIELNEDNNKHINPSQDTEPEHEPIELPKPSTHLETIDIADIQQSLARQRAARLQQQNQWQPESNNINLDIIPEQEIWRNLTHTHTPAARKHALRTTSSLAQPNRFQAAVNPLPIAGVAIAAPTIVPHHAVPDPEFMEHHFLDNDYAAEEFAIDFFAPKNTTDPIPETKLPEQPMPTTLPPSPPLSEPEESIFTETDFTTYYQETQPKQPHEEGTFYLPDLSLLAPAEHDPDAVQSQEILLENSIAIEEKLAEYKVKVKVLDAFAGPVITRYEIEPDVGVRGSSVTNLEKDLARTLGVPAIRVVETIPGRTCMGLELPNPKRQMIRLREILDSPEFSGSTSKLTLTLGQDITGEPVVTDLAKAPHLLVAGTTGSGKSVGVNAMILSMLYKATPDDVRLIMIDPKMLELSVYEGIPHLLTPVVTDMKLAANALTWCVGEMEKRYRLMSHVGVRNLAGYNEKIQAAAARGQKIANPFSYTPDDPEPLEKLPFIVVVVDEFADLMMTAGKQIEQLIARLAQKARAAGIHLILATQRPSVDVITGLIKANIPTRIAFQVSSKIDSRTILDQMGAENLLGQGDMLFLPTGTNYPQRVHGAFVADEEVHRVVDYLKQMGEPDYIDDITSPEQAEFNFNGSSNIERDALFDTAVDVVLRTKKTSISSLQRQLRIGYNKAATIMEQMEEEGIVSAADHAGKRTILAHRSSND